MAKRIICLANSRKSSGRCIAGKEISEKNWIRPISDRSSEEISEYERRYEDGTMPEVLDVITIEIKGHHPNDVQKENYLIDADYYWVKSRKLDKAKLDKYCDNPSFLWKNYSSSYQGLNDRIHSRFISTIKNSLYFIALNESIVIVSLEGTEFGSGKRKVRIKFSYAGIKHILPITDPQIEREYLQKNNGEYSISEKHYLCISIGLPYKDYCYIFVASVIK